MLLSLLTLFLFQLLGECLQRAFQLAIPGPVIGMALLTTWLLWRRPSADHSLEITARQLLSVLGFLFVPAGVGIIANLDLIRAQWLPLTIAVLVSTLASLATTAVTMHWIGGKRI